MRPAVVSLLLVVLLGTVEVADPSGSDADATPPSLVLILTDDQRWDSLWAMPNVQSLLVDHGVAFSNAFVVESLCCPSRASILTGGYSHTTGVYGNGGRYGGFRAFQDRSTVARWLQHGGYETALIGKYLNKYDSLYIPPGWDRWASFMGEDGGAAYYNYDLNIDGSIVSYGGDEADYSTDVLAGYADSFIRETDPAQPLFLYLSIKPPHVPPIAAPRHAGAFDGLLPYRPPNFDEEDVSDKPQWVRELPPLDPAQESQIDSQRERRYETLLSADDAVGTVVAALSDTGRLGNTMIVFASDNGSAQGEHRWRNKKVAYEESIRIPMVIRYDPLVTTARVDGHLVINIDLAPTFGEAAGVDHPETDGSSLVPLLASPDPGSWRTDFLVEYLAAGVNDVPTYCAVRNDDYIYVHYVTEEEELYDLSADFYQLENVASDPGYASVLQDLREREAILCDPPPPGWDREY